MVLEVCGEVFAGIQAGFELGVGYVAGHDNGAVQTHAGGHEIFAQCGADILHRLVEVYAHGIALACAAQLFGDEFVGLVVHLLYPDAVGVDLGLDVAVGRAAHAQTDGAAGAVARQTYHADVVGKCHAAELCAQAYLAGLFQQLLLQLDIAESAAAGIAGGGQ